MASNVKQKYRKFSSCDVPITDLLFGNELKASLATPDSASKVFPQIPFLFVFCLFVKRGMERDGTLKRFRLQPRQTNDGTRSQQIPTKTEAEHLGTNKVVLVNRMVSTKTKERHLQQED